MGMDLLERRPADRRVDAVDGQSTEETLTWKQWVLAIALSTLLILGYLAPEIGCIYFPDVPYCQPGCLVNGVPQC